MKKIRRRDTVVLENGTEGMVLNQAKVSGMRILEIEIIEDKQIEYVQDSKLKLKKQWFWNFVIDRL